MTPDLTFRDRVALGLVRGIGRPALTVIGGAHVIRALTNTPARLTKARPKGTIVTEAADGTLYAIPPGVAADAPWMFHIHGGGFLAGSPWTHLNLASTLAMYGGLRVVLPSYRLAPENPYPAGRDDLRAAYGAHVTRYGAPAALTGDSAGGNLALLVAQHARDVGLPLPRSIGLMSPVADLSDDIPQRIADAPDEMLFPAHRLAKIRDIYLQGHDPADPGASPLRGDLTSLPPTLIQASAAEAAAPDATAIAAAMDTARADLWDGLPHVWHIFAGKAPVADHALRAMAAFLKDPA